MRRWITACLALIMLFLCMGASAESTDNITIPTAQDGAVSLTSTDIAKLGRLVSDTPTHVTVGNATPVSGQFFTDMWGSNTSDMDVRTLLHGYNTVAWSSQVQFVVDTMVVREVTTSKSKGNTVYTIALQTDLTYCDGQTPVTAKDYVFSLLLCASPELAQLGADSSRYEHVVGYDAYHGGKTPAFSGVRLIDDYTFSIAVKADHETFFYDLANIWCMPCPLGEIAPGCDVVDTKKGAKIASLVSSQSDVPFSVEVLQKTLFNETTGYLQHPVLTTGPYMLTSFDSASGELHFKLNPYYKGNYEGVKPVIDTLTLRTA